MEQVTLKVEKRDTSVKAAQTRREGLIPAEYYGHGVTNISLQIPYNEFRRVFKKAGSNTVIDLDLDGDTSKKVLVAHVDYDPVKDTISHVEFINVRMDEEVTTKLPIRLEGVAPAVKELGGVLVQSLDELEVTCLPGDLVHEIVVNIESIVDFSTTLHVSDITVPAKIKVLTPLDTAVATVTAPQEEEAEPEVAPTAADVEITTEKKDVEEGAEGGSDKKGE